MSGYQPVLVVGSPAFDAKRWPAWPVSEKRGGESPSATEPRDVAAGVEPGTADPHGGWPASPTHIHDVGVTVVMAHPHAAALPPSFGTGGNPLRSLILDAQMREFYREWDGLTVWAVRWLRDLTR